VLGEPRTLVRVVGQAGGSAANTSPHRLQRKVSCS
jgi:hypothetical protein